MTQADKAHTATTQKTRINPGPVACHAGCLSPGWGQVLTQFPPSPAQMASVALLGWQGGGSLSTPAAATWALSKQ